MSLTNSVVVCYSEIGLKGGNRGDFEKALVRNLRAALKEEGSPVRAERVRGRIFLSPAGDPEDAAVRARDVFGVSLACPAMRLSQDWDRIVEGASAMTRRHLAACPGDAPVTFRVSTRRADKGFARHSEELNRDLGALLLAEFPRLRVRLDEPELDLGVELRAGSTFLFTQRMPGPGGLPVGTLGRIAVLLSGGIDSPVAAYLCMKRGCEVVYVHFHSTPYTGELSREKALDLIGLLARYQPRTVGFFVPFEGVQGAIRDDAPERYRTVLYRRMMHRIAERIAREHGARAVATGDNLGQVASQTLENLACIDAACDLPVLRPLLTYEKNEIVTLARRIGTFETSIRPHPDCCTLFQPANPVIHGRVERAARAEERIPVERLVAEALAGVQTVEAGAARETGRRRGGGAESARR